ncbi:MAG: class I SAM-dependent methyltransferase [Desulfamplus sp.]|nr:class I SAM-dependent methyltransferase [Desulfamplus sp.]
MLSNRVNKRYKHLAKRYAKQNIEIFRLYDWDIPEINAVIDWYAGHLVVAEYIKKNINPLWLPMMAEAVAGALGVEMEKVHLKQRHTGYQDGRRYEPIANKDKKIVMSERDLKFYINLDDYVDTGLFADHRDTRLMVRDMAQAKDFLNLYCYTASFSCYAAKGGAKSTVSVDRSERAIQWAKENMELNSIVVESRFSNQEMVKNQKNILIKADTFEFLQKAKKKGQMFDLAVVDPPSFSSSKDSKSIDLKYHFDIAKDHIKLLADIIELMRKGSESIIFFSTNHQDFNLGTKQLLSIESSDQRLDEAASNTTKSRAIKEIKEITDSTIPEDYKTPKKQIHRCWKITLL